MSRSRSGSLGRRLSCWLALQSLAVWIVLCAAVYGATALALRTRQSDALLQKQAQLQHLLAESVQDGDAADFQHKLDDAFMGQPAMALTLVRADGATIYRRPATASPSDLRVVRFAVPAPEPASGPLGAVLMLDIRDDMALLRRIGFTVVAALLVGTLLVSAGGSLLVRIGLRPLRELVNQTRQLAADRLHRRLDGSAQPEELEPLIAQFNELLGRLEQAYTQLEGFNADVAHELCTPLATMIGTTELAMRKAHDAARLRELLGSNLEELQRVAGIVNDMLFLSQVDRGASARRVAMPSLAMLARQVASYHEAALADAGLDLEVSGDAGGMFDTPLLQRALSNLIGNATRYAKRGTAIRVEVGTAPNGEITMCVVNHCSAVAPHDLMRWFDRCYRGEPQRSDAGRNHGLGLSIVAAIARMHGGRPLAMSADGLISIGLILRDAASE